MTARIAPVALAVLVAACSSSRGSAGSPDTAGAGSETAKLNAFFEQVFQRKLDKSPVMQTYLGIKTHYDRWTDISDERATEDYEDAKRDLAALRAFDFDALDAQGKVSYRLFEYETERDIAGHRWRYHTYPINQMTGDHQWVPAFLINFHRIDSVVDAKAYVERLRGIRPLFEQVEKKLVVRQAMGILPPKFVFPMVIGASRNVIRGAPFDGATTDSTLLADFRAKVGALEGVDDETKELLVQAATTALVDDVKPAYESLIALLEEQAAVATGDDGAWKLPDGAAFYAYRLERMTTTNLTADRIHDIGLAEVARIHGEMKTIMAQVGFEGTLPAFFEHMRTDAKFFYSNDDAGREAYLARAREIIGGMKQRLPELFNTLPKADMIVKRVEPFREQSAGKAFYNSPAPDGSRPGIYYANLYDMADMPTYQMEALAYHEGIPGHHMQNAIAQELEGLPKFRRFGGYTAYGEGWGLYSELIPKEMGLYEDPYSDFGRLAMELWRACRLVVDTGIHAKKWTRQQAIDYLRESTPNPEGDVIKAIDRYIVAPGQATAYKIGMLEILSLRKRAKDALGDAFDIRAFHDVVLTNGPVPLTILGDLVDEWIATAK